MRELFERLYIPAAVFREVVTLGSGKRGSREVASAVGSWIDVETVRELKSGWRLGAGESEAIALAISLRADVLLLDEQQAVDVARGTGLAVVRTGTVYLEAKTAGLIGSVRERLDKLRATGFWLSDRDYQAIVRAAEEM